LWDCGFTVCFLWFYKCFDERLWSFFLSIPPAVAGEGCLLCGAFCEVRQAVVLELNIGLKRLFNDHNSENVLVDFQSGHLLLVRWLNWLYFALKVFVLCAWKSAAKLCGFGLVSTLSNFYQFYLFLFCGKRVSALDCKLSNWGFWLFEFFFFFFGGVYPVHGQHFLKVGHMFPHHFAMVTLQQTFRGLFCGFLFRHKRGQR